MGRDVNSPCNGGECCPRISRGNGVIARFDEVEMTAREITENINQLTRQFLMLQDAIDDDPEDEEIDACVCNGCKRTGEQCVLRHKRVLAEEAHPQYSHHAEALMFLWHILHYHMDSHSSDRIKISYD